MIDYWQIIEWISFIQWFWSRVKGFIFSQRQKTVRNTRCIVACGLAFRQKVGTNKSRLPMFWVRVNCNYFFLITWTKIVVLDQGYVCSIIYGSWNCNMYFAVLLLWEDTSYMDVSGFYRFSVGYKTLNNKIIGTVFLPEVLRHLLRVFNNNTMKILY